jgi:threonine/homoserine/homoserine lactone efflux protein
MTTATLLLFIPACFALNLAPGPNNLLSISNATRHGVRAACVGGLGRLAAFVGMIGLASVGLAVVLHTSAWLFGLIKLAGAAYLFYLAFQLWRAPVGATAPGEPAAAATHWRLAQQEFWVAVGNPKAILIFTAFLPQFVDPALPAATQLATLGLLFLLMEALAIVAYAVMGLHLRRWLAEARGQRLFNRGCAALLAGAGLGLLASRRANA